MPNETAGRRTTEAASPHIIPNRGLDNRPIADPSLLLAPTESGPFTILDGHKRSAAFHRVTALDGRAAEGGTLPAYVRISAQVSPFRRDSKAP